MCVCVCVCVCVCEFVCVCVCITLRGETIETVYEFKYLRAIVEVQSEVQKDVEHRKDCPCLKSLWCPVQTYFPRSLFIPDHKKNGVPFCGARSASLWAETWVKEIWSRRDTGECCICKEIALDGPRG